MITMVSLFVISSCSSTKDVKKDTGFKEIEIPCSKEGKSNKDFYRADASATSVNMQVSREKSLLAAKQRLSGLIQSTIKSVTDRYLNDTEVSDRSSFEQKFENLTREVIKQSLIDVTVTCEKTGKMDNDKYQTFTAVEVSKEVIKNGIIKSISNKDKMQVDYDKKKFEETYYKAMENMEE